MCFVSTGIPRKGDGWTAQTWTAGSARVPRRRTRRGGRRAAASVELEHVLGVQLAGVGEVEAADEDACRRRRSPSRACSRAPSRARTASMILPENGARVSAVRSSGPFHSAFPFSCHCGAPRRSASRRRRRRGRPSRRRRPAASVPRIGAELITGEAMRTRRCAAPIAFAIRCASLSPRPGQNHGADAPSTGARVDRAAVRDVARRPELLEVFAVAGARPRPSRP